MTVARTVFAILIKALSPVALQLLADAENVAAQRPNSRQDN